MDTVLQEAQCVTIKDLAVNGYDLMQLGIKEGVIIGKTLQHLLDAVIDNPENNQRDILLNLAKEFSITHAR